MLSFLTLNDMDQFILEYNDNDLNLYLSDHADVNSDVSLKKHTRAFKRGKKKATESLWLGLPKSERRLITEDNRMNGAAYAV